MMIKYLIWVKNLYFVFWSIIALQNKILWSSQQESRWTLMSYGSSHFNKLNLDYEPFHTKVLLVARLAFHHYLHLSRFPSKWCSVMEKGSTKNLVKFYDLLWPNINPLITSANLTYDQYGLILGFNIWDLFCNLVRIGRVLNRNSSYRQIFGSNLFCLDCDQNLVLDE